MIFDRNHVFDGDGHPKQWPLRMGLACRERLVSGLSLRQRVRRIITNERANLAVHALDSIQARLGGFARGDLASGDLCDEFRDGQLIQHAP